MIVLSFALPEESKDVIRRLAGARRAGSAALPIIAGSFQGHEIVIVHTGMGMASAAARVGSFFETLERAGAALPAVWIAAGFGGGLVPELKVGDIVVAQNFSDPVLLAAIASLPACSGSLITTKDVIETAEHKKDLARHTRAIVVDMETAAIHRICSSRGIPMLAVRAISDTAHQDLPVPAAVWFDTHRQRPRPASLLLHLAARPHRIAPFTRFVRGVTRARHCLADFLLGALNVLPGN